MTTEEHSEMLGTMADRMRAEIDRQAITIGTLDVDRLALVAAATMIRWILDHPIAELADTRH